MRGIAAGLLGAVAMSLIARAVAAAANFRRRKVPRRVMTASIAAYHRLKRRGARTRTQRFALDACDARVAAKGSASWIEISTRASCTRRRIGRGPCQFHRG
jgi:hypothetical protein